MLKCEYWFVFCSFRISKQFYCLINLSALSQTDTYIYSIYAYYVCFPCVDKSCYESLFNHEDMHEIVRHLPVCHVEAPGQHEGAKTLPAASVNYFILFIVSVLISNAVCLFLFMFISAT